MGGEEVEEFVCVRVCLSVCPQYLNSGPGGIGGFFVHEKHAHNDQLPRYVLVTAVPAYSFLFFFVCLSVCLYIKYNYSLLDCFHAKDVINSTIHNVLIQGPSSGVAPGTIMLSSKLL